MNDASVPKRKDVVHRAASDPRPHIKTKAPKSDLLSYWHTAKHYKWSILGVALLGALIGFLKATSETPMYQANLTLLIEPKRLKSGSIEEVVASYASPYQFYQTQSEIIKSRAIAERIAAKLKAEDYALTKQQSPPDITTRLLGVFRNLAGQISGNPKPDGASEASQTADRVILARLISGGIQVDGGSRSQIVKLRYESPDPDFAAAVVNNAAESYIELSLDTRLSQIKVASGWLNKQIEDLRQKVADSEARLQAYQTQESLVDTAKLSELTSGRLAALNAEVTSAQVNTSALEKRYGEKHPAMVAARAELAEVMQRLQNAKSQAVQTQSKSFQLAKLERDVSTYRQLYDQFLTRFKETDLAMRYDVNDIRVIDAAEPPTAPVRPNKQKIITTWTMLGLLAGILLTWLRDFLDNTFKSPHDIEQQLSLPVLGVVPYLDSSTRRKSKHGRDAVPERFYIHNLNSGFAESVNHIRTSVLYTDVDNPPKVIMIASAVQAEGKTTLCTNLALAFSKLGRTLLVDADLRKPRVATIAGLVQHGGLADVVAGHAESAECFNRDEDAENLYIIKSGTQPPNPLELISSDKFARLLTEFRARFDYILLDSPPVLPVSDAIVLGSLADASILAVRGQKTHRSASISALNSLHNADVNVIGVALTQVSRGKSSYYNDGYYGYYGDYYGLKESSPSTA